MGAENEIHASPLFKERFTLLLRHAPAHSDHHVRIGALKLAHLSEGAVELLLPLLSDTAGINEHKLRFIRRVNGLVVLFKDLVELLRIVFVHRATEGADIYTWLRLLGGRVRSIDFVFTRR